jgi:hypothetical protein
MRAVACGVVLGVALAGCGAPPPITLETGTFYQFDDAPGSSSKGAFERPYPPLDQKAGGALPEYVGVSILGGTVRLSRPADWKIRRASLSPERRYIEYVSPNEYLFAIYERLDSPADPWRDVLGRYEEAAKAKGVEILGQRIPIATFNAQGREYIVKRTIKGQRAPYAQLSSEALVRAEHRVELVEIVHQGQSIAPVGGELLRVMDTMQLL